MTETIPVGKIFLSSLRMVGSSEYLPRKTADAIIVMGITFGFLPADAITRSPLNAR
jgi:hypothetical protein